MKNQVETKRLNRPLDAARKAAKEKEDQPAEVKE